jgi:chaperone required for assembly of F1-ATPase
MKRFWKEVSLGGEPGAWRVLLDLRGIKTAGGREQAVHSDALAEALAAEWVQQGEEIDPRAFKLRDLADYAIDIVSPDRASALADILRFAESDTLCYRAEPDEALHARQLEVWEPLLLAAEQRWDVHFTRTAGVIHQSQPGATLERLRKVLDAHDPFTLAALQTLASLAASLVVALAAIEPGADSEALWSAANLEEDWQADLWGKDTDAEALRAARFADFAAAMLFAGLVGC